MHSARNDNITPMFQHSNLGNICMHLRYVHSFRIHMKRFLQDWRVKYFVLYLTNERDQTIWKYVELIWKKRYKSEIFLIMPIIFQPL